ncbi:MAG TPA: PrsW family intramembrane metalloprotease [Bacteroidia bacterium]|nr:PrsW family intramembrane metalloprotease [Bacteroidia bacterium]
MFLIYSFLFVLLIGFINFIIQKLRKDKKYKRKFYDFEDGTSVVYVILFTIITYFSITIFLEDTRDPNPYKRISYGKATAQPWLESSGYKELTNQYQKNVDYEFHFIKSHFDENQDMGPDVQLYDDEGRDIFNRYTELAKSNNKEIADLGELGLGIYYYYRGDHTLSLDHLQNVNNHNLKYLNTYLGIQMYYFNEKQTAIKHFAKEIGLKGDVQGAYLYLSRIYDNEKEYNEIIPFAYNDTIKQYIPYQFKQRAYIAKNDVINYFKNLLLETFKNVNLIGFLGALLIVIVWMYYLKRVNVYQSKNWFPAIFTVVLSAIFVLPVWLLYDVYKYGFGFDENGEVINDFLYCVFGIGVIEELVKLIPFLIILKFTRTIKEPIDYIMYASLSALGFAFVENCLYFENGSINIIHSRALTASVGHMIFSSIIGYGIVLAKFRYKKNQFLIGLLSFFIAAFAHGFYDFWLFHHVPFITFLFLLTGILVYASFINNALNHSMTSDANINLNTSKLSSDLAAGLIAVFVFEFIAMTAIYGPSISSREFISSTLSGGYLILFCSVRLSNIDIIPNLWAPLQYFAGLLPAQIIYGEKKPNYNSLVGKRIGIRLFRKKTMLENLLPAKGQIVKREQISGFSGWFLVKLDEPLAITKSNKEYILIRAKEKLGLIRKNEELIVSFTLIPDLQLLENNNKKLKDFKFIDWAIATQLEET